MKGKSIRASAFTYLSPLLSSAIPSRTQSTACSHYITTGKVPACPSFVAKLLMLSDLHAFLTAFMRAETPVYYLLIMDALSYPWPTRLVLYYYCPAQINR